MLIASGRRMSEEVHRMNESEVFERRSAELEIRTNLELRISGVRGRLHAFVSWH